MFLQCNYNYWKVTASEIEQLMNPYCLCSNLEADVGWELRSNDEGRVSEKASQSR